VAGASGRRDKQTLGAEGSLHQRLTCNGENESGGRAFALLARCGTRHSVAMALLACRGDRHA
jgi:hypothetical protein